MNQIPFVASFLLFAAAAGAGAVAMAWRPPEQGILGVVAATQDTAYLDCAVVQRDRVPEPDLEAPCSMLA